MYGLAMRILQNSQEAEDLVQEVFYHLWHDCRYDPDRGSLKTFLLMMVHSRSLDRLRSRKTSLSTQERFSQEVQITNFSSLAWEKAEQEEMAVRVRDALAELPENQRKALTLAYFEGLSQSEIARQMDTPLGTVKSWFRLSFDKLRKSLADYITP